MKFFITGTDTGIGKTMVSALICHALKESKKKVTYIKAVQTGREQGDDDAKWVLEKCPGIQTKTLLSFKKPLSPHFAAELEGKEIDSLELKKSLLGEIEKSSSIVVEGAGGIMVPLGGGKWMIDLIVATGLPVIVVARASLGTINHSLLTIEGLKKRVRVIHSLILNESLEDIPKSLVENNLRTLRRACNFPVFLLPRVDDPSQGSRVFVDTFQEPLQKNG